MPVSDGMRAEGHLYKAGVPARCLPASAHLRPQSMFTMSCMAQSSSLVSLTSLTQPSCAVQDNLKHCRSRQHGTHCTAACQPSWVAQACACAFRQQCPHCRLARPAVL